MDGCFFLRLPDIELPSALVDNKWGRCASLKPGTHQKSGCIHGSGIQTALCAGRRYELLKKGEEYAHGGLSLQECLTLQLKVTQKTTGSEHCHVEFTDVVWKGLRCTVAVDGDFSGLRLDIRTQPGNSLSSVAVGIKPLKDNGTASVVVEDEDMEGRDATLVLIDTNDALMAQVTTIIGGGKT